MVVGEGVVPAVTPRAESAGTLSARATSVAGGPAFPAGTAAGARDAAWGRAQAARAIRTGTTSRFSAAPNRA